MPIALKIKKKHEEGATTWKSRHHHWHQYSRYFVFALQVCFFFFFWKKGTFMFLNECLIIRHQHILLQIPFTLRFPIHLSRGFHWCSRKKAVRISERTRPFVIRKNSLFENFWNFPCKTSMRKYSCKPS